MARGNPVDARFKQVLKFDETATNAERRAKSARLAMENRLSEVAELTGKTLDETREAYEAWIETREAQSAETDNDDDN